MYTQDDKSRLNTDPRNSPVWRTEFRRDFARLIHSPAYRRLQGKTQVFPGHESDFFRNRITHSQEVAQVAKSIAMMFNYENEQICKLGGIDLDLVEFAALAHDLGHPPFGHNGEKALDDCMINYGGFEGNAQTLRILTKVEKKSKKPKTNLIGLGGEKEDKDHRCGLNLTARSLASILKYDNCIPSNRLMGDSISKGYYESERFVIENVKRKVAPGFDENMSFKTIECGIMDIADDIAYSTFDLEDAFKSGILTPLDLLSLTDPIANIIAEKVSKAINKEVTANDVRIELQMFFHEKFKPHLEEILTKMPAREITSEILPAIFGAGRSISKEIASNGFLRAELSSSLINEFILGARVEFNEEFPALSKVELVPETLKRVEIIKQFVFTSIIMSPRLQILEYRGMEIVKNIFNTLADDKRKGQRLLPDDCKSLYEGVKSAAEKKRVICDFIAGMTDRYAIEFYGRLNSENPQSLFKPMN